MPRTHPHTSPSHIFSTTQRDDPREQELRDRIHLLNTFLYYQKVPIPKFGLRKRNHLGPNNPNAYKYSGKRDPRNGVDSFASRYNGKVYRQGIHYSPYGRTYARPNDAAYWTFYAPHPILSGYHNRGDAPSQIHYDEQRRPHKENGPALVAAGFALYYWHGTQVPEPWIMDKANVTPQEILTHPNQERRRAAIEIIGWDRLLSTLNPRTIDAHKNPEVGTLIEVDFPRPGRSLPVGFDRERFLRVQCGTKRQFAIPVPRTITTARAAQAWIWGVPADQFKLPEVRT